MFSVADARDTVPGVSPASRPCILRRPPLAWLLQTRPFLLRRRPREGSEHGRRGRTAPVEVVKDFFDHGRIFNARDHFHRTAAVFTSLDIELEHAFQSLRPRYRDVARGCWFVSGLSC